MKCRQTGIAGEVWQAMGFTVVNMPGGEIIPSAQRGVIDCAEWVGGVEDLRLGFHNVWKYHYSPGVHENTTVGELLINGDVWKALTPQQQEIVKSAANETFLIWYAKWQRQNADALKEMQEKHGVQILRTPPEILIAFLKKWDEIAAAEGGEEPVLQEGAREPARLRLAGGAGQALLLPAVLVRGQLLLPGEEVSERCEERRRPTGAASFPIRPSHERGAGRNTRGLEGERSMAEPSRALLTTIRIIDTFTDLTGSLIAWLSVPLVVAVAYEVFARYLFNAPTIWSFDLTYMLYGALFMLGAAYALHKGAHIRTDFFWENVLDRARKGLIDSISYVVFFFPSFADPAVISWHEALVRLPASTRPPTRRRGGRSCGRSRRWCRSPACCC